MDLRLSDFGSSLLIHPSHPPTDGIGLGTLPFSAPELVDPDRSFAFPVDVFALGATLYQCLSGTEPFRGLRSVEMMHQVRRGGLWDYEDRERFNQIRDWKSTPSPSAWREEQAVKRGGSLRLPTKPKLARNISDYEVHSDNYLFLDGLERVPDRIIETLKAMLSPVAELRPTAAQLCTIW